MTALESIERDQQALAEARQRVAQCHGDEEQTKRQIERMEKELRLAKIEAQSAALLPGYEVPNDSPPEAERLEAELEGIRLERTRYEEELHELEGRLRRKVHDAIPGQIAEVEECLEALVLAYEQLVSGGEPLPVAYRRVLAEAQVFEEEKAVLDRLLTTPVAHEDPALWERQKSEAWAYLRGCVRDVSMEARLGFVLADLMRWVRKGSSPFQHWLRDEFDLPALEGSVLGSAPIPAAEDLMHKLSDGYLPLI